METGDKQDRNGFYVEPSECVTCGCCQHEAPEIFAWRKVDGLESSAVIRQPETPEELAQIISAASICMTICIYYGGNDKEIIQQHQAATI